MTKPFLKNWFLLLLLVSIGLLSACGGGGADEPYVFPRDSGVSGGGSTTPPPPSPSPSPSPSPVSCVGDTDCAPGEKCLNGQCGIEECAADDECDDGKVCIDATCTLVTEQRCTADSECSAAENGKKRICNEEECIIGCRADADCSEGETCNTTLAVPQCEFAINPETVCEVRVDSYLELRIDAVRDRNDIPNPCPSAFYPNPPHTDLFCCTEANRSSPSPEPLFGNSQMCDLPNTFSITQWGGNRPMKLLFDIGDDHCNVFLRATDFPRYLLEHSALPGSLAIDSGANLAAAPSMAAHVGRGTCRELPGGGIQIEGITMQFLVTLYDNFTRCQLGVSTSCAPGTTGYPGPEPFSEYWSTDISADQPPIDRVIQALPGLANPPLTLTTGTASMSPPDPSINGVSTVSINGGPLRFVESENKSRVEFVTAVFVPNDGNPDLNAGTGQLQAELGNALLTARIGGVVTNPNASDGTIRGLQHLRDNCGQPTGGGGDGENNALSLSARLRFQTDDSAPLQQETLTVEGDVETGFEIDLCLPGLHNDDGDCVPVSQGELPYAKAEGDPLYPSTTDQFAQNGTVTLTLQGGDGGIQFDLPPAGGAFQIGSDLLDELLEGINILADQETDISLPITFTPQLSGLASCTNSGELILCNETKTISENPEIKLFLHGTARKPAPLLKLEEVRIGTFETGSSVDSSTPVQFAEKIVNVGTDHKLFRLKNDGVRAITIDALQAQDGHKNFRLGSVYQGPDFENRAWRSDQSSWTIPPSSEETPQNLFFFLNYGPFATEAVNTVDPSTETLIREDQGSLYLHGRSVRPDLETEETITLQGRAKNDRRATLSAYIQDDNRRTREGSCREESHCNTFTVEGAGETSTYDAYEPDKALVYSFRQDGATREIFIKNRGGLEPLRILQPPCLSGPSQDQFTLVVDGVVGDGLCTPGEEPVVVPDYPITLTSNQEVRLGRITFNAESSGSFEIHTADLVIKATSGNVDNNPPRLGANENFENTSTEIHFALKGTHAAPTDTRDLVIHRLMAGTNPMINPSSQQSRLLSTTTRGLLERYRTRTLTASQINDYVEVFTLTDGIELNPVTGQAYINPIVTPIDPSGNLRPASEMAGLRLYNGLGSITGQSYLTEHRVQCEEIGTNQCSYFYLFLADSSAIDVEADCGGHPAIQSSPSADVNTGSLTNVLVPTDAFERGCLEEFLRQRTDEGNYRFRIPGSYDPATGELNFYDLAVRLFAPDVPVLSSDIDSHMRIAFSTECITPALIPDEDNLGVRLVPNTVLQDQLFDQDIPESLMDPENRNLIDSLFTGDGCEAANELHGRRIAAPEPAGPNSFDYGTGSAPGPFNFDLVGLGKLSSSFDSAAGVTMYVIIKAEIR